MGDAGVGARPLQPCFRILGPLEIWTGTDRLRVAGPRQRKVLAALLVAPGAVVPAARLMAVVWGNDPPLTAGQQVQTAVSDVRRQLRAVPALSGCLSTEPPGYALRLLPGQCDATVFAEQVTAARQAQRAGRIRQGAAGLRAALALWRGPAL